MEDHDEPELWVLGGDDADADGPGPDDDPAAPELTSTLTTDDVAGDDWIDTSWLDELAPAAGTDGPPPPSSRATATGRGAGERTSAPADVPAPPSTADAAPQQAPPPGPPPGPPPPPPPGPGATPVADTGPVPAAPAAGPAASSAGPSTADEFAGLVEPIADDEVAPSRPADADAETTPTAAGQPSGRSRRRSAARGDEVSEFLRELSRLALDDD